MVEASENTPGVARRSHPCPVGTEQAGQTGSGRLFGCGGGIERGLLLRQTTLDCPKSPLLLGAVVAVLLDIAEESARSSEHRPEISAVGHRDAEVSEQLGEATSVRPEVAEGFAVREARCRPLGLERAEALEVRRPLTK